MVNVFNHKFIPRPVAAKHNNLVVVTTTEKSSKYWFHEKNITQSSYTQLIKVISLIKTISGKENKELRCLIYKTMQLQLKL